jgi:hypothetical protein
LYSSFDSSWHSAPHAYTQPVTQTYVLQYRVPEAAPPRNGAARFAYASAPAQ